VWLLFELAAVVGVDEDESCARVQSGAPDVGQEPAYGFLDLVRSVAPQSLIHVAVLMPWVSFLTRALHALAHVTAEWTKTLRTQRGVANKTIRRLLQRRLFTCFATWQNWAELSVAKCVQRV
jgi:hypothetical protein